MTTAGWQNSTVIDGEIVDEVRKVKQQPGKDVLVSGSITLVSSLVENGLLDELELMVCPMLVGQGRQLFEEGTGPVSLALSESRALGNGGLHLTYRPGRG